jgi:hypothetical protein
MARDNQFSSEVHVLAGTLHPYCVNQHLVVRRLISTTQLAHHKRRCKNLPTSEVTQWHEQRIRATLRLFAREGARPLTRWPESATNNHQLMPKLLHCFKPSRWWQPPRETRNPQPQRSPSATKCNHSSKCTWITQSHFGFTIKQERLVGGSFLSS